MSRFEACCRIEIQSTLAGVQSGHYQRPGGAAPEQVSGNDSPGMISLGWRRDSLGKDRAATKVLPQICRNFVCIFGHSARCLVCGAGKVRDPIS